MPSSARMSDGENPSAFFARLLADATPTQGDLLYAGNRQKTRMLDRTARGVDYQGRRFAPYNYTRPYYWTPWTGSGRMGRGTFLQMRSSAARVFKKMGGDVKTGLLKSGATGRTVAQLINFRRFNESFGASVVHHVGIKFRSYADFKRSLGRAAGVDLMGPRAPHMLQALVVISDGIQVAGRSPRVGLRSMRAAGSRLTIGIYGDEADRAEGHNEGTGDLPQRRFFDASDADLEAMAEDVAERIALRITTR